MLDFAQARQIMILSQLRPCDVTDALLLDAVNRVPRELFVPKEFAPVAYVDQSLSMKIGSEQRFLLQPMVTAKMIQALEVKPGQKILDIAGGLGYSSAILAELGASVVALEENETLASTARERLKLYDNVQVISGALDQGCFNLAPFDSILINGTIFEFSDQFLRQLKDGGRLVCIRGEGQRPPVTLMIRSGDAFGARQLFNASSKPLKAFHKEISFSF